MEGTQILSVGVTISWHDIDCIRYESRRWSYFRREETSLKGQGGWRGQGRAGIN